MPDDNQPIDLETYAREHAPRLVRDQQIADIVRAIADKWADDELVFAIYVMSAQLLARRSR